MLYTIKNGGSLPENGKVTRTDEHGRPILSEKTLRPGRKIVLRMFLLKTINLELGEDDKPRVHIMTLPYPENRALRMLEEHLGSEMICKKSLRVSELADGTEISVERETRTYTINGDPIVVVNLHKDPESAKKDNRLFKKSEAIIRSGLSFLAGGSRKEYVWAVSSAAQMLTFKGYFVRSDFQAPKKYLRGLAERGFPEKAGVVENMGAADVLRTMISYGAYLDVYLGKSHNPANVIARLGLAFSSSKTVSNDIRVGCFGKIHLPWSDEIESMIRNHYESRFAVLDDKTRIEIDNLMITIEKTWKSEKWDGQSILRASWFLKVMREKYGLRFTLEQIEGLIVQFRYSGCKGTAVVVADDYLNCPSMVLPGAGKVVGALGLEDEQTYPYAGYDLIVEENSMKFSEGEAWQGEPEFELCHVDSLKASSYVDLQTEQALDLVTGDSLRELSDSIANKVRASFMDVAMANTVYGITGDDPVSDSLELNSFKERQSTVTAAALAAYPDIIRDPSFRMRTVSFVFKSYRSGRDFTKVPVDGSTRFVVTDPSAFFRTDLAEFRRDKDGNLVLNREGLPMFDIVITSPSQLAMQEVDHIWDNGDTRPCILSRNPCVHPGEIVPARGAGLDDIQELETEYGTMDFKPMFKAITRSFVLSAVSPFLDILGGADTDGDRLRKIMEPSIVAMHSPRRFPLLVTIKSEKPKEIISEMSLREYRATRLKDSKVGIITSTAAAWRDLQHQCKEVYRACKAGADRKEWKLHPLCIEDLQRAVDLSRKWLKAGTVGMEPDEIEAINAIASIKCLNQDAHLAGPDGWVSLVYTAGEKVLAVLRKLQEIAISSNKSSAWVDMSKYRWLALYARPSWYAPAGKKIYPSRSPLGQMRRYMVQLEKDLRASVAVGSRMIPEMAEIFRSRASMEDYQTIRQLMAEYGNAKRFLIEKVENDDLRINAFDKIAREFNMHLMALATEVGVDTVSAMVYAAVYNRNENLGEHANFLWSCWGDQFVSTLRHISSGIDAERTIPFTPVKAMERRIFPDAVYKVESGKVYQGLDLVATAKAKDGLYGVKMVDRKQYLVKMVSQKTVEQATASYKGLKFQIIGWSHKTFDGQVMTRSLGRELIEKANGILHITAEDLGSKVISNVNAVVDGSDIPVGNIPMAGSAESNDSFLSRALSGLRIRVRIPQNADAIDRRGYKPEDRERMERVGLTVEIVEVLSGGDNPPEGGLYEEDDQNCFEQEGLAEAW